MSSSTSRSASSELRAVHLIGALVAGQRLGRADGVAERAVEGGGIFCRVGHDLHVEKSGGVQPLADGADAAIHHVRRRDDVAAGFGLHQRLAHQHRDRLVVEDFAVLDQAVMAVAGEGIERDVAEHAEVGKFLLDRAHRLADQIVRIERLRAVLVAQRRLGIGKQRDAGNVQLHRALGLAHRLIDAEPLHAGHRGHGRALVVAVDHEQRPDQIVRGEDIFPHQPARPFRLAIAARANHQIEGGGGEGGLPPWRVAQFDRTPEFDRHVMNTPGRQKTASWKADGISIGSNPSTLQWHSVTATLTCRNCGESAEEND